MAHVVENKDDFELQLSNAGDKLIVIDFCANWCGPCKIIAPKLEELAIQYAERAVVLKVNVDDNEEITGEYNITSMPTFVFIKNGEVVEVFVGGNSDKLVKTIEKYVGDEDEPDEQTTKEQEKAKEKSTKPANAHENQTDEALEEVVMEAPRVLEH